MELKVCRGCGALKPATGEHFARNRSGRDGLNSWCKVCKNRDGRARRLSYKRRGIRRLPRGR